MSVVSAATFQTLPVELIEYILNLLDTKTILFSFSHVCQRFRTISHHYNHLSIEFTSDSSYMDIQRIFRVARPQNIIALTLDNSSKQSKISRQFLSCVYLWELTGLRSLTLCNIDESDFQIIMKSLIKISPFTSLSLSMEKGKHLNDQSINLLSAVIAMSNLRHLTLDVNRRITDQISWPDHCPIRELKMQNYSDKQHQVLCHQFSNLQSLTFHHYCMLINDKVSQQASYKQLTSLTFSDMYLPIDDSQSLLSLFPSLTHLTLQSQSSYSFDSLVRFSQWEYFLREKLPLLKKFRFYIYSCSSSCKGISIQSVLTSFCTPFWLEEKQWFVTGEYYEVDFKPTITLYLSTPSKNTWSDHFKIGNTFYFTKMTAQKDHSTEIKNQWIARCDPLRMRNIMTTTTQLPNQNLFRHLSELVLDIQNQQSFDAIEYLSPFIDLSQLNRLGLLHHSEFLFRPETIKSLLEQASNLCTFALWSHNDFIGKLENICSVILHRVKHLHFRLKQLHWMKLILTCIKGVPIVTVEYDGHQSDSISNIIRWLKQKRKTFLIDNERKVIEINLGANDSNFSANKSDHKRRKLTHDGHTF